MQSQANDLPLDDFLAIYQELHKRYDRHENARALLNDVAAELLSTLQRKGEAGADADPRKYFLWLLGVKGFYTRRFLWRDVDRPLHQCNYQPVKDLPLDEFDHAADARFSVDPRNKVTAGILVAQAMEQLTEKECDLLEQRLIAGYTLQEIATEDNVTPQAIKKRLDRIYALMRERLSRDEEQAGEMKAG
ncbi:MAG: hypothetical protein GWP08_03975 [Nitrospiraceae bacterium]|nr:hypothetical protein [Nitrospiraceae bacterium]